MAFTLNIWVHTLFFICSRYQFQPHSLFLWYTASMHSYRPFYLSCHWKWLTHLWHIPLISFYHCRYSLSDDDYTDLRKSNLDEAKFDSESGYLSYRRYNSVEEEAGNDGMHYRRNPRDENDALSAYTNAELDSMNGNSNRLDENESTDRRMKRNSSMRSMGRRTKINLARRSYSDDIKHEGEDVWT